MQSVPTDFYVEMGRPRDKRNLATEGFDVVLSSSEGYMEGKPGSVKVRGLKILSGHYVL